MDTNTSNWLPKSVLALRDYSKRQFFADSVAGVTVGLVALPLAMAFAIASGVTPQAGLYTAVVAGISDLRARRIVHSDRRAHGRVRRGDLRHRRSLRHRWSVYVHADGGILLVILGVTGLGMAVKYIPRPVVVGFTNGIAVIIASTQIKDFFGIKVDKVPGISWRAWRSWRRTSAHFSPLETALGCLGLAIIIVFVRYVKRVPGYIVALFAATLLVWLLHLPVETIGTRFGGIPSGLPSLHIPKFRADLIRPLISSAITVAMLGAIESLLSAVVSDRMSGDKHNPSVELVAQGIANIFSPLFGGIPATGAIARTATNIRSGARTPVSGMIHALTVLAILLFAAPMARFIPLSVLAAILFVVSYNMGEWGEIPELLKLTPLDIGIWLVTFALTVFADLTVAVEAGMILAALVFIRKVTATTKVSRVTPEYMEHGRAHTLQDKLIPPYVAVFRIHGPFLFGATEKLENVAHQLPKLPPILILRLRNMTAIDATGLQALEQFADRVHASGRSLILCGAPEQPARLMHQAEFEEHVGRENICESITKALHRAQQIHDQDAAVGIVAAI